MTRRALNFAGFVACAGMMAYALYAQYVLELYPCPLCVFQRVAVILLGVLFLVAALHNPGRKGAIAYAVLTGAAAIGGAAIAARHVWLQNLPPDRVPPCGAGLDYLLDNVPLFDAIRQVLTSSGECAIVTWNFLGLSMPAWVGLVLAGLALAGILGNLLLPRGRSARL